MAYHFLADVNCLAEDCAETDTWEDVDIALKSKRQSSVEYKESVRLTFLDLVA